MKQKIVMMFFCFALIFGGGLSQASESSGGPGPNPQILAELKLFSKAASAIIAGYVDEANARDLLYHAVAGMLASLDRYSMFIDPKNFEYFQMHVKGAYGGLGAELIKKDGLPAINKIMPGGAAEKAGLQIDDRFLKVGDVPVSGKELPEVSGLIRGEVGSSVTLTIWRTKENRLFDVSVTRSSVEIPAVHDVHKIGKAIGYLRVSNFQENTFEQFNQELEGLVQKEKIKALIIDLRDNGGGLLPGAIQMAEKFIPKGKLIVTVQSKIDAQRKEHMTAQEKPPYDFRVVILVNHSSASASEVFSAAMQFYGRATIVGEQTFGKASVQSIIPLDEHSAMKLTTARYLTPGGKKIDHVGITPDLVIPFGAAQDGSPDTQVKAAVELLKEFL